MQSQWRTNTSSTLLPPTTSYQWANSISNYPTSWVQASDKQFQYLGWAIAKRTSLRMDPRDNQSKGCTLKQQTMETDLWCRVAGLMRWRTTARWLALMTQLRIPNGWWCKIQTVGSRHLSRTLKPATLVYIGMTLIHHLSNEFSHKGP